MLFLLLSACNPDKAPESEPSVTFDETECGDASTRLGEQACVHQIPTDEVFEDVTITSSSVDQLRVGKYMVPATDAARLPPVFVDVGTFALHYDFLVEAFPDLFAGLSIDQYEALILHPDTREFYAGTISLYIDGDGFYYGFTVWDDPADSSTTITESQVEAAWTSLQERFNIGELVFVPNSTNQQAAVPGWGDTAFEVRTPAEVDYEVYNPGTTYGYLRLYNLEEFTIASETSAYGYQDIVVIEEAPEDLTRVVSGIVTGTRQGTLSHLNVRSSARGTPNCYVREPLDTLTQWKDQLVQFECGETDYSVQATTLESAQVWWDSFRPDPVAICPPDLSSTEMPGLLEVATSTQEERATNLCRYGAKGSNLATLYHVIDREYQLDGFVIPFYYYDQFTQNQTWTVDLGSGPSLYTFEETLSAYHEDAEFLTDATIRTEKLTALRDAMMAAPVDPDSLDYLMDRIVEVWGNDTTMVRLRSSSNAEDGLVFSGAGLYESVSVCVADELDGDSQGPSKCDASEDDERTVSDGIREVWASLWGTAAWEERDWYGVDHLNIAMGVLCDTRYNDESANIVAFSGNPTSMGDWRYLINAQAGDLEVVSAEPGIYPEKVLLTVDASGVTLIERVSPSSEVAEVLTDAQLQEFGAIFYEITQVYPNDYEIPAGGELLWDTEWKILADGTMKIKQIRPFLREE